MSMSSINTVNEIRPKTASLSRNVSSSNESMLDSNIVIKSELQQDSLLRILTEIDIQLNDKIIIASENGDLKTIREIIDKGYDMKIFKGMNGFTLLHYAASRGHIHITCELLKRSLSVNITNNSNETALHLAVYNGNILLVEQLLDYGADINSLNLDNETPLFYAAKRNFPAIIRLLLQRGADDNITDIIGDKAIDHTISEHTKKSFDNITTNKNDSNNNNNNQLPNHLLLEIFKYLTTKEISFVSQVSTKYHRVCENEVLWNQLGMKRWEYALQKSLGFEITASDLFRRPNSNQKQLLLRKNSNTNSNSNSNNNSQKNMLQNNDNIRK